eukprot:gnl/Dysnectes_brevis/83_a102_6878.p1 GENE.gnl/Dysnectes_brevis/83_a102_6878~~gnl/Dysnectes_brevis/83_a102_6878.p1  ORF type:complete len:463 (+),score=143.96 gnl/Dysnectes_brevis/83_a102_6878:133-1521(+)
MKLFLVLLLALAVFAKRHTSFHSNSEVGEHYDEELWFTNQFVNHMDNLDLRTWSQRYYLNDEFYVEGGPIILFIGGEGDLHPNCVGLPKGNTHYVTTRYAQEIGALAVGLEHRFYGMSVPLPDTSDIFLLSSQQALADLARFIDYVRKTYATDDAPVVSIGGSYAGSMSAYLHSRHPTATVGAVASSGPVHAQADFTSYLQHVSSQLQRYGGSTCVSTLAAAYSAVEDMLEDPAQWSTLEDGFNTCTGITATDVDQIMFLEGITDPIAGIIQYALDGDIADACSVITSGATPLEGLQTLINREQGGDCVAVDYAAECAALSDTSSTSPRLSSRSWTWQVASEFGYWQMGSYPFSTRISREFFDQQCVDVFGYTAGVQEDWTNVFYGGKKMIRDNIAFSNGDVDPWHLLGVTADISDTEPAFYVTGGSHCSDLYNDKQDREAAGLEDVRFQMIDLIKGWVGQK